MNKDQFIKFINDFVRKDDIISQLDYDREKSKIEISLIRERIMPIDTILINFSLKNTGNKTNE